MLDAAELKKLEPGDLWGILSKLAVILEAESGSETGAFWRAVFSAVLDAVDARMESDF